MAHERTIALLEEQIANQKRTREFNRNDLDNVDENATILRQRIAQIDATIADIEASIEALKS